MSKITNMSNHEENEDDYEKYNYCSDIGKVKLIRKDRVFNLKLGTMSEEKAILLNDLDLREIKLKNFSSSKPKSLLKFNNEIEFIIEQMRCEYDYTITVKDVKNAKILGKTHFYKYNGIQMIGISPSKKYVCIIQSREVIVYDTQKQKYMKLYDYYGGEPILENNHNRFYTLEECDDISLLVPELFKFYSYFDKNKKENLVVTYHNLKKNLFIDDYILIDE
jgi:hypothetical protein